ncbi:flagellar hook capping FlgD N-terminal domain-containing protein [Paludibacterium paludis]|uniref:Basal-body rod modification protein FlgD n=1 Tax=Paludibacterium paludis TaxID=1225769 RepID=A0A918NXX3_9NEIS|nr:flagellar hook capping FlgD N-terminal domain-containing protein [Paludibacterium paludis]GGY04781.1 basal-body rod modification protein FlgD [Paludibacterium paludis]
MSNVNAAQGGQTGANTRSGGLPAAPAANGADTTSNMFMTLLVAQIKNQNPLEPTDASQFVNQLTQMSQMQATQQQSAIAKNNAVLLENLQTLELGRQVGSPVMVEAKSLEMGKTPVQARVNLSSAAGDVTLNLIGEDGQAHPVSLGRHAAGAFDITVDPAKLGLAPGRYKIETVTDTKEKPSVEVAGVIESVRVPLSGGGPLVKVSNVGEVGFASISQFNRKSGATA